MALTDSTTGNVIRDYSIEQLKDAANLMRGYDLIALCAAGSGHAGGTLSVMDITAALYLKVANHDPQNPSWPDRDRIIWSTGHNAPSLYLGLAVAGFCPVEDVMTLRKLGSMYQGHPDVRFLPALEASTGSLGEGISVSLGMGLAARLDNRPARMYVAIGDGESQEGQIWESAMFGRQHSVDNVCVIVDYNRIQLDGFVADIMDLEPIVAKWQSFGWHTVEVDGHSFPALQVAFAEAAATKGRPTVLIAHTIKGKGVSFMENNPKFHGTAPTVEEEKKALEELA